MDNLLSPLFLILSLITAAVIGALLLGPYLTYRHTQQRIAQIFAQHDIAGTRKSPNPNQNLWDSLIQAFAQITGGSDGLGEKKLQQLCAQAGLREKRQILLFNAIQAAALIFLPLVYIIYAWSHAENFPEMGQLMMVMILLAAAYYAPLQFLHMLRNNRAQMMQNGLPDLIDLLVICTESGLALDQALTRAAKELSESSPILADEFHLLTLEIRAGAGRARALRNLAERIHLDDMTNFTSMLIQADRFGTSVAEALRIQSDVMRTKRSQRAEEIAAKIPSKILLPVILCIFPVLLIVIIAPAAIQVAQAFPG